MKTQLTAKKIENIIEKIMNKFQAILHDETSIRDRKEKIVLEISAKIAEKIGINPNTVPPETKFTVGKYFIRVEHRCFTEDWVDIWEIVPGFYSKSLGYENNPNPPYVKIEGTRTINLPPGNMIEDFLSELDKELA